MIFIKQLIMQKVLLRQKKFRFFFYLFFFVLISIFAFANKNIIINGNKNISKKQSNL
jgi:hypothetical protein